MRLTILIPIYNEAPVLERSVERVRATAPPAGPGGEPMDRTIVLIDDGSTDGSAEIARRLAQRDGIDCVLRQRNAGKGRAIADGLAAALEHGTDAAIIQDADLEYDPADHARVLEPIVTGQADAVIGSRFIGQTHRVLYYWHSVGNRALTTLSNMLSNLNLTDMECGTKAFSRPVLDRLRITEPRFGVEPEIVAKLARMRLPDETRNETSDETSSGRVRPLRIYEVPVRYAGRTYAEGKKIGWRDGFEALRCIAQHNLLG